MQLTQSHVREILKETYDQEAYRSWGEEGLTYQNANSDAFSYDVLLYEDMCETLDIPYSTDWTFHVDEQLISSGIEKLTYLVENTELYWPRYCLGNLILRDYDTETLDTLLQMAVFDQIVT